jgi:hypothetical protein
VTLAFFGRTYPRKGYANANYIDTEGEAGQNCIATGRKMTQPAVWDNRANRFDEDSSIFEAPCTSACGCCELLVLQVDNFQQKGPLFSAVLFADVNWTLLRVLLWCEFGQETVVAPGINLLANSKLH